LKQVRDKNAVIMAPQSDLNVLSIQGSDSPQILWYLLTMMHGREDIHISACTPKDQLLTVLNISYWANYLGMLSLLRPWAHEWVDKFLDPDATVWDIADPGKERRALLAWTLGHAASYEYITREHVLTCEIEQP
jgi:hypothetical protein